MEKVKRFTASEIQWKRKQQDRPLPELIDGQTYYEVEMILGKKEEEEWVEIQMDRENANEIHPEKNPPEDGDIAEEEEKGTEGGVRRSARLAQNRVERTGTDKGKAGKTRRKVKPMRVKRRVLKYLVKWKGYGMEEASWESEESLIHAREAIDEYEYRQSIERGEEVVGEQWTHTIREGGEEEDGLILESIRVNPQGNSEEGGTIMMT